MLFYYFFLGVDFAGRAFDPAFGLDEVLAALWLRFLLALAFLARLDFSALFTSQGADTFNVFFQAP